MKTLRELADELNILAEKDIANLPVVNVNWEHFYDLVEDADSPVLVTMGELRATFGTDCIDEEYEIFKGDQLVWAFNYQ